MDRDPTPGDPSRVKALSLQLHDFADDVESALRLVRGMQSEDAILSWAGLSADAFRDEFGSAPKNLDKLHTSYRLAADALEAYWPDLEHAQSQADRALADGRTAHAQLTAAQGGLNGAQNWVHTAAATAGTYDPAKNPGKTVPPPDSDQVRQATRDLAAAKAQQAHAQQAVTSAQSALDAAKRLAEQARGLREDAARRTVTKLHEASDAGIKNRHWWEKAVHWVADHWDDIVTVCKWIVAILGIVVMIIGGPLAWLVVAAALLVLADTISKYIQGKATLWDVLFAALDCIPMTKGLTSLGKLAELYKAGGLLRIGAEGVKGAITGLKNLAGLIRSAGSGLKQLTILFRDAWRAGKEFKTLPLPPAGSGAKLLEVLDESRITRKDGLITKIDGRPVSTYLKHVTDMRVQSYKDLIAEGGVFRKKDLGDCIGIGVDRRTGHVYEGINGRKGDVLDPSEVHPTIQDRVDRLHDAGPFPDREGNPTFDYPHPDLPLRHAEVKATNMALHDRAAAGLADGASALPEITMNTHFVYTRGGMPAPFCANCHQVLGDVTSVAGRFPGWPPSDDILIPGDTS
ncbi:MULTISPECIES: putative T7SS-secreted protein [unclassified Streptomyces]|uniref:putative T7SS-secreted protein n=1 Tax=unclassified Streptomyces TaxID=2593676 RepID=UPI000B84CA25|nr:hypothetical protein [Streptomyces sp. SID4948]